MSLFYLGSKDVRQCDRSVCKFLLEGKKLENSDDNLMKVFEDDGYFSVFEISEYPGSNPLKTKILISCLVAGCGCAKHIVYSFKVFKRFKERHAEQYENLKIRRDASSKSESPVYWYPQWSLKPDHPEYAASQALVAGLVDHFKNIVEFGEAYGCKKYPNKALMAPREASKCRCLLRNDLIMPMTQEGSEEARIVKVRGDSHFIPMTHCKDLRELGIVRKADNLLMKARICEYCKILSPIDDVVTDKNDRTLLHYNFRTRYKMCMLCRKSPLKDCSSQCAECDIGLRNMYDEHAKFKGVFEASIMALQNTFNCQSIVVKQEVPVNLDKDKKYIDAVVTFVVGKIRHVFMLEFQNTGHEVESVLIHKFMDLRDRCISPSEAKAGATCSKTYLVCVKIGDRWTNDHSDRFRLEHKLDIIRSWMLVVMLDPNDWPEHMFWCMFYDMHSTNGTLDGKMDSPLSGPNGAPCCDFLKYPLHLNSAPNSRKGWKYACDPYTVPPEPRGIHEERTYEISKISRRNLMQLGENAIDPEDANEKMINITRMYGRNQKVIHCNDKCKACFPGPRP